MVAIIIPLYKEVPSEYDIISLNQCFKVFHSVPIIAIKPASLNMDRYLYPFSKVLSLENGYFENIASYNALMMSPMFYRLFLDYKYILIYQTDAFVFKDMLLEWCQKDYDYVGAPWLRYNVYPDLVKMTKEQLKGFFHRLMNLKDWKTGLPTTLQLENRVGNGGFSLRRTSKFYKLSKANSKMIESYLSRSEHFFNEDVFWSIELNRYKTQLKIPSYKEAVFFSIESFPNVAMKLTKGELPFGCHAWEKNLDFFRPIFRDFGYDV